MQPLGFEHFSSNDHNSFLENCSIAFTGKTDESNPTRSEKYCRRILKTVCYSLWTEHDRQIITKGQKILNSCRIFCIFWGKSVNIVKYTLFTYFISSISCFLLDFVFLGSIIIIIIIISLLLILLLLLLVLLLISLLLLLLLFRISFHKVIPTIFFCNDFTVASLQPLEYVIL